MGGFSVIFKSYGRNNVEDPLDVGSPVPKIRQLIFTEVVDLVNADPDNDGACTLRPGFVKRYSGNVRSMFANDDIILFHEGPALKRLNPNTYAATFLNLSLDQTGDVAYCDVNGLIVYSDGAIIRKVYQGVDYALATPTAALKEPTPPGRCFAVFKQHLLVGQDDGFVVTDPATVDEMDSRQCYFPLGGPAIEIVPVDGGLYVSTDERTYYIEGHGLPQWLQPGTVREVLAIPIIPGTAIRLTGEQTGLDNVSGNICLFATSVGYCYGLPGGIVITTRDKVRPGAGYVAGTAVLREVDGMRHYLTVLRTAGGEFHGEVVNVKTQGAARYSGYDFRSIVRHKGRLFGCNAEGIFELTGTTDNGTSIEARGLTGITDCGTGMIKSFPDSRLTLRCSGQMELTVAVDEGEPVTYPVEWQAGREGIHKKRRKLARGVRGGRVQVGWRNLDGCDFYLGQIELDVEPSQSRRVR